MCVTEQTWRPQPLPRLGITSEYDFIYLIRVRTYVFGVYQTVFKRCYPHANRL